MTPYREPWRTTLRRTGAIALAIGIGVGVYQRRLLAVPLATLVALWFTLGGHYVELLFRNQLGPFLAGSRTRLACARLVYWFAGGSLLFVAALATWALFTGRAAVSWSWWTGGAFFVVAELLLHLLMRVRQQPSFYDGRG